jgi:hypothetical protein
VHCSIEQVQHFMTDFTIAVEGVDFLTLPRLVTFIHSGHPTESYFAVLADDEIKPPFIRLLSGLIQATTCVFEAANKRTETKLRRVASNVIECELTSDLKEEF